MSYDKNKVSALYARVLKLYSKGNDFVAKKQFKAESKRLLDLMVNSIYTHKEIFLRELISNASDATDKRYYSALSEGTGGLNRNDLPIEISLDSNARTLTICDKGCGMNQSDMENNLGVIAKSGSLDFKQNHEQNEEIDIIGQFGVGFYSAFMVAEKIQVISRPQDSTEAWCWESSGADGYTITSCEKVDPGTTITLFLKEDTEDENYTQYLDNWKIQELVKKYSDYIRYPIRMEVQRQQLKEQPENTSEEDSAPEYETVTEIETLNSMIPIWKRSKSEVSNEELGEFYKEKFYDYTPPLHTIRSSTEGAATYTALLFIPSHAPMNYYSKEYQKGLQLYASGVLIMEQCNDLLPDYFGFVKGLVDSQDLSLNISREMLQHDRQLKVIASRLEKKINSELVSMQTNERENYETFFKNFGLSLKFGVYSDYGAHKEELQDLLLYLSSAEGIMTSLSEYVARMPEDQKYIYYACGDNVEQIKNMPSAEAVLEKGYEILYMTDDVDEFVAKIIHTYQEKELKSIADADLGLESEEEKKELEKQSEEHKELFDFLKESLNGKVSKVCLTSRLKSYPVCISSEGDISLEMEKVLNTMPGNAMGMKAQRVLELNPEHPVFDKLNQLYSTNKDKLQVYATVLYEQALLIEGMAIEDPTAYSQAIFSLLA